ncbi:unnamed protein product [Ectocarpus sp. CCAP 1310/34]|nr:unnamed protein product [Ectocarpus sp. CCAP 1310/34]
MCSRGLRTSFLGVVVGVATVESMTVTARSGGSFLRMMVARSSPPTYAVATKRTMSMSVDAGVDAARYTNFIKDKAKFPNPPRRLPTLLRFLQHKGLTPVDPADRAGLNPFLVPLVKDDGGVVTGLLRWPTSPETLEMPVVRNGETGLELLADNAEHFIRRVVAQEDFAGSADSEELIRLGNEGLPEADPLYEKGAVEKLGVGVEKYLALRVGAFADVYEWLTASHLEKGDSTAALASAEKANEIFVGWGRPYGHYARVLAKMDRREMEAKDAAKVSLRCPCWTISPSSKDLEEVVKIAGYEDMASVRTMYEGMAADEQPDKINEGKSPMQVALDRAAHLMDAVAFGHKDWDGVREELAERYDQGGIPDIARFVRME